MSSKTHIASLLSGFFNDTLSAEEQKILYNYIMDGQNREEIIELLQQQWEQSLPFDDVPSEAMFLRIKQEIKAKEKHKADRLKRWIYRITHYAAIFAFAFGLSLLIVNRSGTEDATDIATVRNTEPVYNEILVPYGSKTVITLSDSTKIWLNAGARLKYPANFNNDRREVFLQGEGFFDVTKDEQRPFFVKTNGMNIKVLGTKFNLMANADDNKIEASLVEGAIEVLGLKNDSQGGNLTLKPGQKLTLQKDKATYNIVDNADREAMLVPKEIVSPVKIKSALLSENNTDISTAWKENKLIFVRERFADVKLKLERWYGVIIEVRDNEILDYRFTGTFEKQTFEQAMSAFGKAASCHFKIRQNKVIVTKN
jgi:ferric-dicitrate binding protein FerR (iron transport regulator)